MNLTLGCDPECFLADIQGQLKSSIGKVGGSKSHPLPLPLGEGYAVQEDNVALEFNIPPAHNKEQFVEFIQNTMGFLGAHMQQAHGLMIVNTSAESFPASELLHPAAQEFGCDPDYNAWTGKRNPKPHAEDKNLRSCGGHVHVGLDTKMDVRRVMCNMDLFLGVPSVLMDKGELRKNLYGKAGAHRTKPFGGEYRVLSNFWIFNPKLIGWVWDNTHRAVEAAVVQPVLQEQDHEHVQNCINNNDKMMAEVLIDKYKLEVVHV